MLNRYENPSIEERIYEKLGVKAELMYSSIDKGELMSSFDFDKDLDELLKR